MVKETQHESFRYMDEVERLLAHCAAERLGMPYHQFLRHCVLLVSRSIMDEVAEDTVEDRAGDEWKGCSELVWGDVAGS